MEKTDYAIVTKLRRMAEKGSAPAQMLREIIPLLGSGNFHKLTLIAYMREAFFLSLAEAGPIAGWSSDATGELQDEQLNKFISPAITKYEDRWKQGSEGADSPLG